MIKKYAILDQVGGWLLNLVLWDGDESKWKPNQGEIAALASEVDFSSLPEKPEEN
jgi:hypothetical protein